MVAPKDTRCSIRPKGSKGPGSSWEKLLGKLGENDILAPLRNIGLVFQYAPHLTFTTLANWSPQSFGHTNYSYNAWENSDVSEIMLASEFTAESEDEAKYMLAVIHFLKSATKGGFGQNDGGRGVPPAVYNFNYLGNHQFKDVPVVITNVTLVYDNSIDYIPIVVAGKETLVPAHIGITIMIKPQYNPKTMIEEFTVSNFRKGTYLKTGGGLL